MNIQYYTKNLELTANLKNYISEKINSLENFLPKNTETNIQLEISKITQHHHQGPFYRAEVNIFLGKNLIRAKAEKENIFWAISEVKDKLQREIKKLKEKRQTEYLRGARFFRHFKLISPLSFFRKINLGERRKNESTK